MSFVDDRYDHPPDDEREDRRGEEAAEREWWAERRYRLKKRQVFGQFVDDFVSAERVESVAIAPAPAVNGGHEQLSLEES